MKTEPQLKVKLFEEERPWKLEKKINDFIIGKEVVDISINTKDNLFYTYYLGIVKYRSVL